MCSNLLKGAALKNVILFSLWVGILSSVSWGFADFVPLKEKAQAHSLTGAIQGNESIYSNPAASSFSETYTLDGTFAFPKSFSASILDTRTSTIGSGLGYFKDQDPLSENSSHGLRLSLASKASETMAVAIAGKAIWLSDGASERQFKDVDAGVLWNLGYGSAGIVLRNLMGGNEDLKKDREISIGGRVGYSTSFFLSASAHSKVSKLSPYEYGFGVEYVSPWHFSMMGGYRFQTGTSRNPSYWSTGLSFLSPRLSLHYAVEFPQQLGENTSHLLGTTMIF
jgi:hypothetical protein